ncbi:MULTISPECIES: GTPase HflX [unclassified Streptococcus]|uniref:GTPase HflX n=1 Tax=unclassified Streptococcus TaxID=2608887 RepID=UPI001072490D|nr:MULTISPECIES: GTPase HflX [unclassified Streptococcus]MBF0805861.1 GTPase HflX [Streptococcus sp. 19428wA2_WM07]TFU28604.1 GTPase HflX [Streptococcus sp. WM07]
MINTEKEQERVLLLGVELPKMDHFLMSMEELARLTQTAGAKVIKEIVQKRERPDARSLIGSGKVEEIRNWIEAEEIDSVVVNNRLTPRQNTYLETQWGVKVIDRMQLILDIFALRAKSYEGKLQVHLAQLQYLLPRLVGQGIMLSRQGGGIGSRGPGESQLELNRRAVRNQITDIERQLKAVEKNRNRIRQKRLASPDLQIGLIGYTNAGKSTIMNILGESPQYEADELFATLDAATKKIHLDQQLQATLTDTVGFIQDLPTELVASFKSTLEESRHVDLLIHVIDASDPYHEQEEKTVLSLMQELDMDQIPRITLYNKLDRVNDFVPTLNPSSSISAHSPSAKEELKEIIVNKLKALWEPFEIRWPLSKQYRLHELEELALIGTLEYDQAGVYVSGWIAEKNKWRLEAFYE